MFCVSLIQEGYVKKKDFHLLIQRNIFDKIYFSRIGYIRNIFDEIYFSRIGYIRNIFDEVYFSRIGYTPTDTRR